jgi:Tfp pilus assembly protein PilO
MNKLSKEKRDRLILVAIGAVAVVFGLCYLWILPRYGTIKANRQNAARMLEDTGKAKDLNNKSAKIEADLQEAQKKIEALEGAMLPVGNEYMTLFNWLKQASLSSKVKYEGELNHPAIGPMPLLPGFPYKAATFNDTIFYGHYHDFGKFLADLENNFPYMQFQVVKAGLPEVPRPDDPEQLRLNVRIVALVQPAASR